ncbi:MAG: tetratricopeptide repeat protein [Ferruginibacter sp.]
MFNEIHQLPENKYYLPANYYYGVIAYKEKNYKEALTAFKLVENEEDYQAIVPYYISEIYYLQGNKTESLKYSENILSKEGSNSSNQLKLLTGQLYFEKQDYKKAMPLLEEYVNNSDKINKEVLYELAYSYYKEGKTDKAIAGFKQLSNEKDSMGQNSMYLLGDLYLKTGDKANARNAFQYSAYNSSNASQQKISRFNYAKLSYELGYQDIALNEMRSFLQDYPSSEYDEEAREILINVLARTSNFREAMSIYQSFSNPTIGMQKAFPRILYGRAIEFINDQQLAKADQLMTDVTTHSYGGSIIPYAYFWKGEIAFRQQRYDDAVKFTNQFVQSNSPSQGEASMAAARYNLGYSYMYKDNYQKALDNFLLITSRLTRSSSSMEQDAYLRSGDSYYMLRDYSKAGVVYDAFIDNSMPQADYATYQKAMIAGIRNSNEKIRLLNNLERQFPKSSLLQQADMEVATTFIADEKFSSAIPYLNKVIASDNNGLKPKAYLKLGLSNYNNNNNKEALVSYNYLIRNYPNSPEANEALSIVRDIYVEEGRLNEYADLMRKAGKNVSVSEVDSLSFVAAELKYENNKCDEAISAFSNYISTYPTGSYIIDAQYLRSDCYLKKNNFSDALNGFVKVSDAGFSKYYERGTLEAARIYYFELKDYAKAKKYFQLLIANASTQEIQLEALRGLVRSQYQLKDYTTANESAKELLSKKGINTDDRTIANLVLGKSFQIKKDYSEAITAYKAVTAINKSQWGAEAIYEIAAIYLAQNNMAAAEKAANAVIKETGSYDFWVTKSYILLGDIFMAQKDYFNAKATYESVAKNASITDLKNEAQSKYNKAVADEKQNSKIGN